MKRVAVVSPLKAEKALQRATYVLYARDAIKDCFKRGEAPFASHLFYPGQLLSDDVPEQRALGMACGRAWLQGADLVAVYEDHGISSGMQDDIAAAEAAGIPVESRKLYAKEEAK